MTDRTDKEARKKSEKLSLRLPPRLAARVVDAARSDDRTVSEYVRELLRRQLLSKPSEGAVARQ